MSPTRISYALGALTFIVAGAAFAQAPPEPTPVPPPKPPEPQDPTAAPRPAEPPAAAPAPAVAAPPSPAAAASPLTQQVGAASFTLYGNIDLYANFMHSSSGRDIIALQDGAILRSRLGVRGGIELADKIKGNFVLEQGINATTGAPADSTRLFDRQAWVGIASPYGELRMGRQNTEVFLRGGAIDYGERTLGSPINAFGVPSRYDSDIAYMSPRRFGAQVVGHYSFQGSVRNGWFHQRVYQLAFDYENGPARVGYARVAGKPAPGTPVQKLVTYDNFYANFKHGDAKAYLVYIRSNNNGASGPLFNGGSPLGNTGALVAGTDTGAETYYNIYQVSADYSLTPALRVGGLYGWIRDSSGSGKNASGGSVGAFYTFKNIKLLFLIDWLINDPNAGFRTSGSAGLTKTFTAADDVNGRTITGVQIGLVFRF